MTGRDEDALLDLQSVDIGDFGGLVRSVAYDDETIIRAIMRLFLDGRPFDADVTYSTGRFWRNLPEPSLKFDIVPQAAGVVQADARALPLASSSLDSIMFDPPFIVRYRTAPETSAIAQRFGGYYDFADLWTFYADALREFARVLRVGGIVAFKCQDIVSGMKNYMTHAVVIMLAQMEGFYVRDLFIRVNNNVMWSPNMRSQRHARKIHSYYVVLERTRSQALHATYMIDVGRWLRARAEKTYTKPIQEKA